jgi:tetratricopeptide (TPR) repeat protein
MKKKDFEIIFYENILKERPNFISVLRLLGDAYTKKGFYEEGLAVDQRLANLEPDDPIVHYNLACSLSLLGKTDEALAQLKKAVLFGYDDFYYIQEDDDLENLRKLPEFDKFFAKIKKVKK